MIHAADVPVASVIFFSAATCWSVSWTRDFKPYGGLKKLKIINYFLGKNSWEKSRLPA
jgi:hypothetical protein